MIGVYNGIVSGFGLKWIFCLTLKDLTFAELAPSFNLVSAMSVFLSVVCALQCSIV